MTSNRIVYSIHSLIVVATAFFAAASGIASWYFVLVIGVPLLLASVPRLANMSYTINARILFPISVGLLCTSLYHYLPSLIETEIPELSRYGINNEVDGVRQGFFEVNAIFKDSVTVLYAICAAFLLWKGLTDFDELKNVLYEEANEVRSIGDFSSYFLTSGDPELNQDPVFRLRELLLIYLGNMLKGNKVVASAKNESILEECLIQVGRLKHADLNDQISLEEIMKSLSRISVLRSRRMVCIEKRMSPFILGLMLLMSFTMVGSFFGNANGKFSMDYVYVFLLPAFYTSIFMTLLDLSSPFDGYWSIKLGAVTGVQRKLERQLEETRKLESFTHPSSTPK